MEWSGQVIGGIAIGLLLAKEVVVVGLKLISSKNGKLQRPCPDLISVRQSVKEGQDKFESHVKEGFHSSIILEKQLSKIHSTLSVLTTSMKFVEERIRNGKVK